MEKNHHILMGSRGRFPTHEIVRTREKMWELIAAKLNRMGPHKSVDKWRECFRGMKSHVRLKTKDIVDRGEVPGESQCNDYDLLIAQMLAVDSSIKPAGKSSGADANGIDANHSSSSTDSAPAPDDDRTTDHDDTNEV